MNFLSLNIRGVGDPAKARWVKRLVSRFKISFLAIQETQLTDGNKLRVLRFWNNSVSEYAFVNAEGRSGVCYVYGIVVYSIKTQLLAIGFIW